MSEKGSSAVAKNKNGTLQNNLQGLEHLFITLGFNGTITNDKFCMSRNQLLHLSARRCAIPSPRR